MANEGGSQGAETADPAFGLDADLRERLARVELVVLDVDGVLTAGAIAYGPWGEVQTFHVHDGAGLTWLRKAGLHVAWITGRGCAGTKLRARELDCRLVAGVKDKERALEKLQREVDVGPEETFAMGDDLVDLGLASRAAVFCAPADARPEVRARASWVTRARGGQGAVREVAEALLAARGRWSTGGEGPPGPRFESAAG